jgi:hypothetical protein
MTASGADEGGHHAPVPALGLEVLAGSLATVEAHAARQGGVFTVAQAVAAGLTPAHVRTLVRRGQWVVVRHGVLADVQRWEEAEHLTACAAKRLRLSRDAVVSHESAWVLYQLPYVDPPAEPTLTVPWGGARTSARVLEAVLPAAHITRYGVLPITSGARTVVDVLRNASDALEAQALADGALRAGVERGRVDDMLVWCEGWPGVRQARDAWGFGDPRSESPLESRHRVIFRDAGLPEPELQPEVRDPAGGFGARVDFLFRAQRTVVESDGKVKYVDDDRDRASRRGKRRDLTLWEEKLREDRLRDLGFEVVRATWADTEDGGADLVRRVLRAFDRAARRAA